MINILMYNNNVCCPALMETASRHTEYTKYTRKQAHKQVLAVYSITRTKHAEKKLYYYYFLDIL
jgi:hypothetical protein